MRSLDMDTTSTLFLNFSSRTTANDARSMINANVEKRAKGVYGPIPGKTLVVFIDDMNMPKVIFGSHLGVFDAFLPSELSHG